MRLFSKVVHGVTKGRRPALPEKSVRHAREKVEDCCRQLGWSVDEGKNAREMRLYFKDELIGIRNVVVLVSEDDTTISLTTLSSVGFIRVQTVPIAVLAYLLERNSRLIASWEMYLGIDGNALFLMSYHTYAAGMNPTFFKSICESMIQEVQTFDVRMKEIRAVSLAHLLQCNGPHFGEKP